MNKWVKKSIDLANSQGYLDKLFDIYSIELGPTRNITEEIKNEIKKAFQAKNKLNLMKKLLKLPKFPLNDPYIASLRKYHYLLDKNPKTIYRITEKLLSMNIETILKLASQPKSPSRQFGNSFQNWLKTINCPLLKENEFKEYKETAFLEGSDQKLKQFAVKELKIKNLSRRPDFIFKTKSKFVLGEAKFLTDYGGTQNNQFDGALRITKIKARGVIGIAVLDGIVWFESNTHMYRTIKSFNGIALSALLLEDFIKEINN